MKLKLNKFTGIIPKIDPKLLPDNAAQVADNVNLNAGNLRPLNETSNVAALPTYAPYQLTCNAPIPPSGGNNDGVEYGAAASFFPDAFFGGRDVLVAPSAYGSVYSPTHNGMPTGNQPWTYCGWVYPISSAGQLSFLQLGAYPNDVAFFASMSTDSGHPYYVDVLNGPNDNLSSSPLTPNAWNHVAATYDGTTLIIYINSVAKGTFVTAFSITASAATIVTLYSNPSSQLGNASDLRFYNRALSSSEISSIYASPSSTTTVPSGLISQWVFSTGLNDSVQISSTTLAAFQAVSAGSFGITIGGTPYQISGLNFTGITDLPGAASIIQSAIRATTSSTETCTWNGTQFVIVSPLSLVALTAGTTGTDISASIYLNGTSGVVAMIGNPNSVYDYGSDQYTMTCGASGSLATLQTITNGAFNITIGGEVYAITGLNFSGAASFAAIATIIQSAIRASGADTEMTVTNNGTAFIFQSSFELGALTDYTGSIGNGWGSGSTPTVLSTNTSLTSTQDGDVVVAQYGPLTINSGVTLTTSNRCKGLAIYVNGDLNLAGTISMTGKGASADPSAAGVSSAGIQIMRITADGTTSMAAGSVVQGCGSAFVSAESSNSPTSAALQTGNIFVIPTTGGAGGLKTGASGGDGGFTTGASGASGGTLQSGGGGAGSGKLLGGSGTAGTCFSGGTSGGTAGASVSATLVAAGDGQPNGGSGGLSPAVSGSVTGAGNPTQGGTAGLLMLFVKGNINWNGGSLQSAGYSPGNSAGGGGGGVVLALYGGAINGTPVINVAGGSGYNSGHGTWNGGNGGSGNYVLQQVQA